MEKSWSVWDNKTDELLCCNLTSHQCADILGMKYGSFRKALMRFRKGEYSKYYFEEQTEDEVA